MTYIGHIEEYEPGEDFESYEDRLKIYFNINKVAEASQAQLLLSIIGKNTYKIIKSIVQPAKPTEKNVTELLKVLRQHFAPKLNKRAERFKFNKAHQEQGESIMEYIIRLKALASTCEFGDYLSTPLEVDLKPEPTTPLTGYKSMAVDDALTDKFIVGIQSDEIQRALLNDVTLNFEKCCAVALNMEMSKNESRAIQPHTSADCKLVAKSVSTNKCDRNYSYRPRSYSRNSRRSSHSSNHSRENKSNNSVSSYNSSQVSKSFRRNKGYIHTCFRCGKSHNINSCPAFRWNCFVCHRRGHVAAMCRNRRRDDRGYLKYVDLHFVGGAPADIYTLVVENCKLDMELDTGACTTIISEEMYRSNFSHLQIKSVDNSVFSVTGQVVPVLGSISVSVGFCGVRYELEMIIIKSSKHFKPLIGRTWLDVLVPGWRGNLLQKELQVKTISESNETFLNLIKRSYPGVLQSSSPIKNFKATINLIDNCRPIFFKPYAVPFKFREKVDKELDRLVNEDILVPVRYSDWASPIVIVPKGSEGIRICIDCRVTINKYIITDHYPLPNIEDIFASLSNTNIYCVIDLTGAYQQLEVRSECQKLLTINTHKGLFRYKRLPFGVASAPSTFQSVMDRILLGLAGVHCYLDDIIIGGTNMENCREKCLEVLNRLAENNVTINLEKSKFFVDNVNYLGHTLSKEGIRPNQEKITAIREAPAPKNIQQVQSYLGLLNYYSKFLPNLSGKLKPLYQLLRRGEKFNWDEKCESCFQESKKWLLENALLELYDPSKPIVIATDASPDGVGAVLSHVIDNVEKPVLFASSTLTDTQSRYSQLHREALAIMFAVERFHKYIYGHPFVIYTDCEALKTIFNTKKHGVGVAANRLLRWAIHLSMYDYTIKYRPSGKMHGPDALSRLPLGIYTDISDDLSLVQWIECDREVPLNIKDIACETKNDAELSQVYEMVMHGWNNKKASKDIQKYYGKRDSLSCENNCLFYGNRIVVPQKLRCQILQILHEGMNHAGIVKMKIIARTYVWWNKIDEDIERYVKGCSTCQQISNVPKEIVVNKWPEPDVPFHRIHVDFFFFKALVFLLIVDAKTKYIEVKLMISTTANAVIGKLKQLFAIFGLPKVIVSDNGPPFDSFVIRKFCKQMGITVLKAPPYHPQSNGRAERNVQTIKRSFKHFLIENESRLNRSNINNTIEEFLMINRNTPSATTLQTPTDMIFSFKPRIFLDILNDKRKVRFDLGNEIKKDHRNKNNYVVDKKKINNKIIFRIGEKILYKNHFKSYIKWIPGKIVEKLSKHIYKIELYNKNKRIVHENQIRQQYPYNFYRSPYQRRSEEKIEDNHKEVNDENQMGYNKRKRSVDEGVTPRRSKRRRKVPDRLNYRKF